jgi:hypothetical protein
MTSTAAPEEVAEIDGAHEASFDAGPVKQKKLDQSEWI